MNASAQSTKDRIREAALKLFLAQGYQKTSIGGIETEAGLVPRAGAFYRHFESKEALLKDIARTYISETPEGFGLDHLGDYGDTRAELVAIALGYERSMVRQQPYARLIEEVRLLDFGQEFEDQLNADMLAGLDGWIKTKPVAQEQSKKQRAVLLMNVLGGWLYYLSLLKEDGKMNSYRDMMLEQWASHWAAVLDTETG